MAQLPTGSCVLKHRKKLSEIVEEVQLPTGSCVLKPHYAHLPMSAV